MTYENNSTAMTGYVPHFTKAFFLKLCITYGKHFIHNEYLGFQVGGNCKCKPYIHAGRVSFNRWIYIQLYSGKINNLIKLPANLFFSHSQDSAIHVYVFLPGQFRVKSGTHFQQ